MASRAIFYRIMLRITLVGSLCFVFVGPAVSQRRAGESTGPAESSVTLGGWVRGDYSQGVPTDVRVRLVTDEGMVGGEQSVNDSGYFEFVGLSKTYYRLTVTAHEFQTYEQELDLRSVGDKLVINVQLSPTSRTKSLGPAASFTFTDENAPKNARKEYQKGHEAARSGNSSQAQSHFEKAVSEYPCYVRAQTDLAVVLSAQHQFSASEAALKKALACDPDYLDSYIELGQLYSIENKYQDSAAILKEGLRRSPGSWQFHYQLGVDQYHLGRYAEAQQEYLKAQSLSTSLPADIHVKLADVYLKQRAYEKAYAEMKAYVTAEPTGRLTPKLKQVMHQMESDHTVTVAQPPTTQSRQQ